MLDRTSTAEETTLKTLRVKLTSRMPMLVHNERLANPMSEYTKALKKITSKKKKTDDDMVAISFAEFEGGLYHDDEVGPYVPAHWLLAMIKEAAKLSRRGRDVARAIFLTETKLPLKYSGPRDVQGLWNAKFYDQRMVGNQGRRILRTRPKFNQWSVEFDLCIDETVFNASDVADILRVGGQMCGLGDYRPTFGRFDTEVQE